MCGNPAYSEQKFEPSTGEYIARHWTPVADARSDNGLCGPEALLFQPNSYAKVVFNGLKRGGGDVIAAIAALCLGAGILAMLLGW